MDDESYFDESLVDQESEKEYLILLGLFSSLLDKYNNQTLDLEYFQDIIEKRALFAYGHCIRRFGIDFEEAIDIIRNHNDLYLTPSEIERRKILLAALDNLIDFAAAEETQMYMDLEEQNEDLDPTDIFQLYNKTYAITENRDIDYSATIAAWWINLSEETTLMYMTQGDERVRDSHRALEGLSYPKSSFPEWLIPPIDWRCRCYLIESFSRPNYQDYTNTDDIVNQAVNPIFKKSIAKGGPIFGDDHPYFIVDKSLVKPMQKVITSIKSKFNLA